MLLNPMDSEMPWQLMGTVYSWERIRQTVLWNVQVLLIFSAPTEPHGHRTPN